MRSKNPKLFDGSNLRGHFYLKRLAILTAFVNEGTLLPSHIAKYIKNIYMHRIDRNITMIDSPDVIAAFDELENDILKLKRKRG